MKCDLHCSKVEFYRINHNQLPRRSNEKNKTGRIKIQCKSEEWQLRDENKLLFIIDGAKGLRKGIHNEFGKQALIQRCQWNKHKNVIAYLPKSQQGIFRKKLQKA